MVIPNESIPQSKDLWKYIEPSIGLLKYHIDNFDFNPEGVQHPPATITNDTHTATLVDLKARLQETEKEVYPKLTSLQREIDQLESDISAARASSMPVAEIRNER